MDEHRFELVSPFSPTGDQPQAIDALCEGILEGKKEQVLEGATGTGKTFTMANIIARMNRPTLVFSHNKTLAGQLYSEFKELFPHNRVEFFVSNFDYYQPEAYVPKSDMYIEKTAAINEELDMFRESTLNSLLERRDTIVVASVACIYAASDLFLMPSLFEPCGISQLCSMRYGTLPLVRETGGLKDTVDAYNEYEKSGNGFSFENYDSNELIHTLYYACDVYYNRKEDWEMLQRNALNTDVSWQQSAKTYSLLYDELVD